MKNERSYRVAIHDIGEYYLRRTSPSKYLGKSASCTRVYASKHMDPRFHRIEGRFTPSSLIQNANVDLTSGTSYSCFAFTASTTASVRER